MTILINNAGASVGASFLDSPVDDVRREFETNFYGPLLITRAFAPVIERNGGGHILNVHSALSWIALAARTAPPRPPCGRRPTPCAWSCSRAASPSPDCTSATSTRT